MTAPAYLRWAEHGAAAAGIGLAVLLLRHTPGEATLQTILAASVGTLAAWITWQDLKCLTISDAALLAFACLGFASRWSLAMQGGEAAIAALLAISIDVLLCGGLLLAFREVYYRLKGYDGLGLGDVKLAAAGALLVGSAGFFWALFAASGAGLIYVAARGRLAPCVRPIDRIAFAAALAPALWAAWLCEQIPALAQTLDVWGT